MDNQQSQAFQPKTDYTTDNPHSQTSQGETVGRPGENAATSGSSGDSQSLLDKGTYVVMVYGYRS